MDTKKVVTFGEIMMRLATPRRLRFSQAHELELTYGGGEANVAVSLANFGVPASFVTRLPLNPFGDGAIANLRSYGVVTKHIVRGGDRIGIYFLEPGASQRPSVVVYDRAGSAISCCTPQDFDWGDIFDGAGWFHFTGITPALGDGAASAARAACVAAKGCGLTISCDLNYRRKLWSKAEAQLVMSELMQWVDVLIANEEDTASVFGIHAENSDLEAGSLNLPGYEAVAKKVTEQFDIPTVAITLRQSISADRNGWAAMLFQDGKFHHSPNYDMQIVDRVGGGDSFAAGLIYGNITGMPSQHALNFATAASCLKHSISGDFNLVSVEEVKQLMLGNGSGRVQR